MIDVWYCLASQGADPDVATSTEASFTSNGRSGELARIWQLCSFKKWMTKLNCNCIIGISRCDTLWVSNVFFELFQQHLPAGACWATPGIRLSICNRYVDIIIIKYTKAYEIFHGIVCKSCNLNSVGCLHKYNASRKDTTGTAKLCFFV